MLVHFVALIPQVFETLRETRKYLYVVNLSSHWPIELHSVVAGDVLTDGRRCLRHALLSQDTIRIIVRRH